MTNDLIREAVAAELERRGMSQSQLAEACGVSRSGLCNWLAGNKTITTLTASALMAELGLTVRAVSQRAQSR